MKVTDTIFSAQKKNKKLLAVLIDPDKIGDSNKLKEFIGSCEYIKADFIFVGGSLLVDDVLDDCILTIKEVTNIPVVLFPGSPLQLSKHANAVLFLSLISGRNAELLIGNHVVAAPYLKKMGIEILPTGYVLVDCGNATTVSYISNTQPIPYNKPEIAACTALAGEMLGLQFIYMDGGSGAKNPISPDFIQQVAKQISVPLIVGGGIKNIDDATLAWDAGATVVVIGTAFEKNPSTILPFKNRQHALKS